MTDLSLLGWGDGSLLATLHASCPIYGGPTPENTIRPLDPPLDLSRFHLQAVLGGLGKAASYGLLFLLPIRRLQGIKRRLVANLPTTPHAIQTWRLRAGRVCHQHRLAMALQASLLSTMLLFDLVQAFWVPLVLAPMAWVVLSQLTLVLWLAVAVGHPFLLHRLMRALRRRWAARPALPALRVPPGWLLRPRPQPRATL